MFADDRHLLLVSAVAVRMHNGEAWLDDQTAAGLAQWSEHFDRVTMLGVLAEDSVTGEQSSPTHATSWRRVADLPSAQQIEVVALPRAYRVRSFLKVLRRTRREIHRHVDASTNLCFQVGALVGGWGEIASLVARRRRRSYAVWCDRVEPDVLRRTAHGARGLRRLKVRAQVLAMRRLHEFVLSGSAAALLQGRETYDHYAEVAPRPFCVYDVHYGFEDHIAAESLDGKRQSMVTGRPLRIGYAGRVDEMKDPTSWIDAMARLRDAGHVFEARWLGDGPLLEASRALVSERRLEGIVHFDGFVDDREQVLAFLRHSDVFVFCHRTPESPRCLVEALISGTPLVGFASPYPAGLLEQHGGGVLVPIGDTGALAAQVGALDDARADLVDLVRRAALDGARFDEGTLYAERAAIVSAHT